MALNSAGSPTFEDMVDDADETDEKTESASELVEDDDELDFRPNSTSRRCDLDGAVYGGDGGATTTTPQGSKMGW